MALPKWDQLTDEQKKLFSNFIDKKGWDELSDVLKDRFADSVTLVELLAVPAIGREVPSFRKWTLPDQPLPDPRKELERLGEYKPPASSGKSQGTP